MDRRLKREHNPHPALRATFFQGTPPETMLPCFRLNRTMRIEAIHHVQLAMPAGEEDAARTFYSGLLGIPEVLKPPHLARRGGVWFESGAVKVHLGVDPEFRPARKAHPALLVQDLGALIRRLRESGVEVVEAEPLPGYDHVYVADPFGNRIELMQPSG